MSLRYRPLRVRSSRFMTLITKIENGWNEERRRHDRWSHYSWRELVSNRNSRKCLYLSAWRQDVCSSEITDCLLMNVVAWGQTLCGTRPLQSGDCVSASLSGDNPSWKHWSCPLQSVFRSVRTRCLKPCSLPRPILHERCLIGCTKATEANGGRSRRSRVITSSQVSWFPAQVVFISPGALKFIWSG